MRNNNEYVDVTTKYGIQEEIIKAILVEREFQDLRYGYGGHQYGVWWMLIQAELDEAKLAMIKGGTGRNSVVSELIQVAALCVACLQQHGLEEKPGRNL